jgi:hypothetical protein
MEFLKLSGVHEHLMQHDDARIPGSQTSINFMRISALLILTSQERAWLNKDAFLILQVPESIENSQTKSWKTGDVVDTQYV